MKKSLMKKIALSVLASAALLSSNTAWAAPAGWKPALSWDSGGTAYVWEADSSNIVPEADYTTNMDSFIGIYSESNNDVTGGKVIITGGRFKKNVNRGFGIIGGYADKEGFSAISNTVEISGGEFNALNIIGGQAYKKHATSNTVSITGGTFINCPIYGGFTEYSTYGYWNESTLANNNTVNIGGTANLQNVAIYGGYTSDSSSYRESEQKALYGGQSAPNTLNIGNENTGWNPADSNRTIASIGGFDVINFNNLKWDTGKIALNTNLLEIGNDGLSVNINSLSKDSKPKVDDVMTLIHAGSGIDASKIKVDTTTNIGSFVKAEGQLSVVNDNINFTITKLGGNEQALVIGESRVAATAFTNQGSDLVESGIDALVRDNTKAGDSKFFASLYGNASEYATGSHVKVNGFSGILGFGRTTAHGLTAGAFFEAGEGNYRTYNNIDGDFMRGDGEASYSGGGLLVRKDNANGVYAEASVRAGNLKNELRNAVKGSDGLAGYDINTFYYGAHLGLGVVIPRGSDGDSFDIYSKFIYTHHDSENFKIDGDEFHFDSVESERLRLGFRYNNVFDKLTMYYSAVWEYEFGGDADNTVVGYDLNTPSLKGSTVIGEIGTHYKATDNWSFDLNGRAYVGQREGVSGSLQVNYRF